MSLKKYIGDITTKYNVWPCLDADLNKPNVKKQHQLGGTWSNLNTIGTNALFFVLGYCSNKDSLSFSDTHWWING